MSAIGKNIYDAAKGKVLCRLKPRNSTSPLLKTEDIVIPIISSHLPNFEIPSNIWTNYDHYDLADPKFWEPRPIDFLLGSDLFPEIWSGSTIVLQENLPKLFSTVFGYVVLGRVPECPLTAPSTSLFTMVNEANDLNNQLQRFWELEEPTPVNRASPEDLACEEHFKLNHYRIDGQYVVRLPFKEPDCQYPDLSDLALRRFYSLERRLEKGPKLKAEYSNFMNEYLELGHMTPTSLPSRHIVPHHCVTKAHSSDMKV